MSAPENAERHAWPIVDMSVVTYNSAKWIDRFLASLLRQDYPLDRIRLLVRDHESTDDTVSRLHAASRAHADRFLALRITQGSNLGFGAGHNRNFALGDAGYVLVTNIDLEFSADAIATVVTAARADDAGVACWELRQKPYEHPKYYDPATLETRWSSSACILFRRSAFETVHGYDERIFLYGEDVDISYRLRDRGYKLRYCPKAVCWHHSYEQAAQIKRAQFLGSTLANFYVRLRFGSAGQILWGALMQASLWFFHPPVPRLRAGLAQNARKLLANTPHFLLTRRKNRRMSFPIRRWDFELTRDGAFYPCAEPPSGDLPLVSVIVRTYRGRLEWLREAVASVLNQTYPRVELVIIEDGSDEARGFAESIEQSECPVSATYLSLPKSGRCRAGNAGLEAARGEFLCFLDDDDQLFADHVEVLALELLRDRNLGAVYGLAFCVPTKITHRSPLAYAETRHDVVLRQSFSRPILWHHNYIPIQTVVFRRSLYERYGGFDESLENLEDWNLWTRYSLRDDFKLVEKVTSLFRVPADPAERKRREESLAAYYPVAVERQRALRVELSPADVVEGFSELVRDIYALVVPYATIRRAMVGNPWLKVLYYPAVRLRARLRRRRQRRQGIG